MPSRGDNIQAETRVTVGLIKLNEIKGTLGIHSNMYKSVEMMQSMKFRLIWENGVSLIELGELPRNLYEVTFEIVEMWREITPWRNFT